ncbi:phosphoadenosine phosphosulfate reductase domain-containing protein [Nocardiopsis sp. NPDC055824]
MSTTLTSGPAPDLTRYRKILANLSGGKDSIAALVLTMREARRVGVVDRVIAVHADLGKSEWPNTHELVQEHAAHYGIPLETVAATDEEGVVQTVLDTARQRGSWPSAKVRLCTSRHKRDPIRKLMTRVAAAEREAGHQGPVPILNVMGLRAQESTARRLKSPYRFDRAASNSRRHVDEWLPVHHLLTDEVFALANEEGLRQHEAYALGMDRLSCCFCILGSRKGLIIAARANKELAAEYAAVEAEIGHRFRQDLSMAQVIELAKKPPRPESVQVKLW